jgi:hypothetical protein
MPESDYIQTALEAMGELQATIDRKRRMLEQRDYNEVYRLAGIITILANQQEKLDRAMFLLLGRDEDDS